MRRALLLKGQPMTESIEESRLIVNTYGMNIWLSDAKTEANEESVDLNLSISIELYLFIFIQLFKKTVYKYNNSG